MPLSQSQWKARRAATRRLDAERAKLIRFATGRFGDPASAERFIAGTLLQRFRERDRLQRSELLPAWLERKVRLAFSDWSETTVVAARRTTDAEIDAWAAILRRCLCRLAETTSVRYQEVLRRIDFGFDSKLLVRRQLGLSPGTMDVLLHRARRAARRALVEMVAVKSGGSRAGLDPTSLPQRLACVSRCESLEFVCSPPLQPD